MSKKRYISASEIGDYVFCPRAWALKKLDYVPKNKQMLKEGQRHHEEIGAKVIQKAKEDQTEIEKYNKKILNDKIAIVIVLFCLLIFIVRIFLK